MYETNIAVSVIQDYINTYLFEPRKNWPEEEFAIRSYSRWAANDILERIINRSMILPNHITGLESKTLFGIIQDFIDEADYCSEMYDKQSCNMFSIAKDVAMDIALLFL